jgi:anti-sigma factor RsiW
MTAAGHPIGEDDLQAYVDDRLSSERRRQVEAWLQQHPARHRDIEADRRHRESLRATLLAAEDPIPPALRVAEIRRQVSAGRRRRARAIAAAVMLVIAGVGTGWLGRGWVGPQATAEMADAAAAYRVFTADAVQPIEVRASERARLERWLSNRVGRQLEIPDLGSFGLRLMGGRLLSTEAGPAGLLMYDDDRGARLVFYVRPVPEGRPPGLRERKEADVEIRYWFDGRYGYAVAGPAASPVLGPATEAFRRAYAAT